MFNLGLQNKFTSQRLNLIDLVESTFYDVKGKTTTTTKSNNNNNKKLYSIFPKFF